MPKINLNLSEAESNKPIDPGVYEAVIDSISDVKSGAKSQYIAFVFRIVEEGPAEGRKVWFNAPIEGRGAGIFADLYSKVMRVDVDVDDLEELEIDTDDMIGEGCLITIGHEEYQGETRHTVKKVSEG